MSTRQKITVIILLVCAFAVDHRLSTIDCFSTDKGLVGYWKFDEGEGTVAKDSSGNSNVGKIIDAEWVNGKIGKALKFKEGSYVSLGNPSSLNFSGKITIEAWIQPAEKDGIRNIVEHGYRLSPNEGVFLRIGEGNYQIGSWDGNNHLIAHPASEEDLGNWIHLVGLYDGANWKLYRNGEEVKSNEDSVGAITVDEQWIIGATADGLTRFFGGIIDEVRIYNRELSPDEIKAHYKADANK